MAKGWRIAVTMGVAWLAASSASAEDTRPPGQRLYAQHCLSCHQADGGGVPNMQPAIAGGSWVQGDARALALFVMSGGFDSASRKDSDVGNVMPPFRQLADADLAEILTYIRQKFGNGASPVSAADVAEARGSLGSDPISRQKGPESDSK
jgi:mono/diheme cytochrome c family protein